MIKLMFNAINCVPPFCITSYKTPPKCKTVCWFQVKKMCLQAHKLMYICCQEQSKEILALIHCMTLKVVKRKVPRLHRFSRLVQDKD